jgi:hypothetical protein
MTGTPMRHIVFKETSRLGAIMAGGALAFALDSDRSSGALQRAAGVNSGAMGGHEWWHEYLDVRTVAEAGDPAGLGAIGWTALAAPKTIGFAVADKFRTERETLFADPDIAQRYATIASTTFSSGRSLTPKQAHLWPEP